MESYHESKGTSKISCSFVQASNMHGNSIMAVKREIIVKKKTGIDDNPFIGALELFRKQEKLRKLRNEKSNEALESPEEGEKSVNISIGSSFAPQKQFCCPVKAMRIRNHDTELQTSDAIAMTTTEEPIEQINSNLPTITSDIPSFDPRTILNQNLTGSATACEITPSFLSKTGQKLDGIVLEKQLPLLKGIRVTIEKFDGEFGPAAIESTSLSHVDTKFYKDPSQTQEGQPQTDNEKPSEKPEVKKLKLHDLSKEHINDSFAADTVDTASESNSSTERHSQVQNSNSKHEMDNESYHDERRKKSEKDNEKSDTHILLKHPQMMADEINKTLHKYYLTDRIPGKQSYCTIAKEIHRRLLKNKITDERAISKFVVAFVTGK